MDQPTTPSRQIAPARVDDPDLDEFLGVEPPSRRRWLVKWGLVALGVLLLLLLLWRLFFGAAQAPHYVTDEVQRGNLTVTVSATGNLAPTNQVDVGSEISGLITKIYVDDNDRVRTGQLLAQIDPSRLQDAINQSRAALASAVAQVAQAEATTQQSRAALARLTEVYRLSGGKVPSGTELDAGRADFARALASVRTAQAAVAQAQAQLSSNRTEFAKAQIRSPVNGVVLARQIEPGQTVAASFNAPVLFTIAEDLAQMKLEVKVDEADVGQVAAGQRATFTVDAFPGREFPAAIERVDVGSNGGTSTSSTTTTASTTGTVVSYTARLKVANPDLTLRPGMTATADIVTSEERDVLLVPNAALRFDPKTAGKGAAGKGAGSALMFRPRGGGGDAREATIGRGSHQQVYVLGDAPDATPQAVQVLVGSSDGAQTQVSGPGLRPGMKVITGQLSAEAAKAGATGRKRRSGGSGGGG